MPARQLPLHPDLAHLKYQAKDLRSGHRARTPDAVRRIREFHPRFSDASDAAIAARVITQSDALLTIAREYGFASWPKLKLHVEGLEAAERIVSDLRTQFAQGDGAARRQILKPAHARERFENYDPDAASLSEADARLLLANQEGYAFWDKYDSYLHLDPSVQGVIAAVRCGDRESLLEILRDEPWASNPRWVAGFASPAHAPNDSHPLFCVSEASHRGTNARANEYELVRDLASAGAEVEIQRGMPFIAAVSFNVIRAAEALLDCGAAVDGVDGDGTPLAYAVHFGYREMAGLLAQRGAKLDLRFAAGLGVLDEVKRWFNADGSLQPGAGALVDPYAYERKVRNESPFHCERTRENILSQALCFACLNGRLDVADFLLSQGAQINAIVPGLDSRATILHLAVSANGGPRHMPWSMGPVVRFLVEHGADVTICDEHYRSTALGWALHLGRDEAAELLRPLRASE